VARKLCERSRCWRPQLMLCAGRDGELGRIRQVVATRIHGDGAAVAVGRFGHARQYKSGI